MRNRIRLAFLCTEASNAYNQNGQMTTCVEGVWISEMTTDTQKVRIETGQELNPATFSKYQFYQVDSPYFSCSDGFLEINTPNPELIDDLENSLLLAIKYHDFMAFRQKLFLSDQEELSALGAMITNPNWNPQFVKAYKQYTFSTPARQCLFIALRHLGIRDHLPLTEIAKLNEADGCELFSDQDIGMAANAAWEASQADILRWLYAPDTLFGSYYYTAEDPDYLEKTGFRKHGSF